VIDGVVNGVAGVMMGFSGVFRYMQSGLIHNYAWSMAFGVVVMLGYYVFK
jgi:NADH-quinone oxidoreductase subunit L